MTHPEPTSMQDARPVPAARGKLLRGAVPTGPLCIVINAGAGHGAADARVQLIEQQLRAANRDFQLFEAAQPNALPSATAAAVHSAETSDGVIVASGGDGTLNAVVQQARATPPPLPPPP